MRRKDREKDAAFALEVMRDCEYATLATINTDGTPYCIPISPVIMGNTIYFHCALEGQKLTNINSNSAVCISAVRHTKLLPEIFSTEYESAVATGKCSIISDDDEKTTALMLICEKYAKDFMSHASKEIAKQLNRLCICKIEIEKITGKARRES